MCEIPVSFNEKLKLIGQNSMLIKWNLEIKDATLENLYQLEELEGSRCRGIICGIALMVFSLVQSTISASENTDHFTLSYGLYNLLPPVIFALIALMHTFKYFLFRICYPLLLLGYIVIFLTTPYISIRNAPTHFLPDSGQVYSTSIDSTSPPHSSSSISCSTGFLMLLIGSGSFISRTILNILFAIAMTSVEISKCKSSYWVQSILFGIIQSGLVQGQLIYQEKRRKIRFLERKKENCLNGFLDKVLPASIITARFDSSTCRLTFGAANKTAIKVLNMISEQTFHAFLDICHVDGIEETNVNGVFTSQEFELVKKRLNNNTNQGASKSHLNLKQICKEILMKRQAQQKLEIQQLQQKKSTKTASRNSSIMQNHNLNHKIKQDLIHGEKQKNIDTNNNMNFSEKIQTITQARISTAGQSGQGQQQQQNSQSPTNYGNNNNNNSSHFENTITSLNQPGGGGLNFLNTQSNPLHNQNTQNIQSSSCSVFSGFISEGEGVRKRVNVRIWAYSFVEEHVVICIEDESFKQQLNSYKQKCAQLQFILSTVLRRQSVLVRKTLSEMKSQTEGRSKNNIQYPPSVGSNTPVLNDPQSNNIRESFMRTSSKLKKSRTLDNLNIQSHFKANSISKSPSSQQSVFQSPQQPNLSQFNSFSSPEQLSLPKIFLQKNGLGSQHKLLKRINSARNLHQPTQKPQQNFLLPPKKHTIHKAKSSDTNSLNPGKDGSQEESQQQQQYFQRSSQSRKSSQTYPLQRLTPTGHQESFQRLIPTNDSRFILPKFEKTIPKSSASSQDNSPRNFQRLIPVKESNFSEKKLQITPSNPQNCFSSAIQKIIQSSPKDDFPSEGFISQSNASMDWDGKENNNDGSIKHKDKLDSNQILVKKHNHVTQSSSNEEDEDNQQDKKDNNLICQYVCEDEDNLRISDNNNNNNNFGYDKNFLNTQQSGIATSYDITNNQQFFNNINVQGAIALAQNSFQFHHSRSLATPHHNQEQTNTVSIRNIKQTQDFILTKCQYHLHETVQILNNVDCLLRILYSPKTFKCQSLSAFNMLSIVKIVLRKLSGIIEKKQLFVAVKDSKEISMLIVYTDKDKLTILLQNLIQNALQAAKLNSVVSIEFTNGNSSSSEMNYNNYKNQEEAYAANNLGSPALKQKRDSFSSIQGEQQQPQHSLAARRYGKITPLECVSIPKTLHEANELKVSIINEIQVHENQGKILEALKEYGMITPEEMINTAAQGQTVSANNNNNNNNNNGNTPQLDQEAMNSRVKLLKRMQSQEYRVNSPRASGLTEDGFISALSHRKQRSTLCGIPEQQFQQLQPSVLPSIMTQTITSIQSNWNQQFISNPNGNTEQTGLTLGIVVSRNILRKIGPYEKITYRSVGQNQIATECLIYRDLRHLELDAPSRQSKNINNTGFSPVPNAQSQQGNNIITTPGINLLNGNPEHKSKFCSFNNNNNNNNSNNYSQSNTNSQPTCQNLLSYNSENMFLHRLTKQNSRESRDTKTNKKKKSTIIVVYPEENYSKNMNSKRHISASNHLTKEIKEAEIQGDMQDCFCLESQTKLSQSSFKQDESLSRSTIIPPERSFNNNSLNWTKQIKNNFQI